MAGGPNAAAVPCLACGAKAVRTYEGSEDDHYRCTACARTFGIDWHRGAPESPCWAPTPEELRAARGGQD